MRSKVALLGEDAWIIGAHHYHLERYLSDFVDAKKLDWGKASDLQSIRDGKYDVVIGEAYIMDIFRGMDRSSVKFLPVFHHNPVQLQGHTHFDFDYTDIINEFEVYATTEDIAAAVTERYGVPCGLLPLGVNDSFWSKRDVKRISTVGHVAGPNGDEHYNRVKGFKLFDRIKAITDKSFTKVFGSSWMTGSYIYRNVDMVVCCSESEGTPAPLLECAAAKIPFISTDVGIVSKFPSVKIFKTAEEARDIIESFDTEEKIKEYVDAVYQEVMSEMEYGVVVDRYYKPALQRKLSVVMPTMWRSDRTLPTLQALNDQEFVSEVIVINNDSSATPHYEGLNKVRMVDPGENIYVNPSWNLGVSMASEDYVCIINDDITLHDPSMLGRVMNELTPGVCFGVHGDSYSMTEGEVSFMSGHDIGRGWGCMLVMKKADWVDIPDEMKILCGDNWIASKVISCKSFKMPISTEMSTTARDNSLGLIRGNDMAFWDSINRKVYDCVIIRDELDVLEARIRYLYDDVDMFVIGEANRTLQNEPKEFTMESNMSRFDKWKDKITYVKIQLDDTNLDFSKPETEYNPTSAAFTFETMQRNALIKGIKGLSDQDLVILSDVDEFPNMSAIPKDVKSLSMTQDFYYYYINNKGCSANSLWQGTVVTTGQLFKDQFNSSFQLMRDHRNTLPRVASGGWHFSYLGGVETIRRKIMSFAHTEYIKEQYYCDENIEKCLRDGTDIFGRHDHSYMIVDPNKELPSDLMTILSSYPYMTC